MICIEWSVFVMRASPASPAQGDRQMKKALLAPASLCFALLVALTGCSSGGGTANVSGVGGTSGGGTTGTGGATGPNSLLDGQYAFTFSGTATATGNPISLAGSFKADGMGDITAGVEDYNEISFASGVPSVLLKGQTITGSYTIGTDGRGTLNLTIASISQTFKFAIETNGHGQLTRFDSGASGSGTFDLQTASAFSLSALQVGSYAFDWNGTDSSGVPYSAVGAFNLSSGTASGGAADLDDNEPEGGTYVQDTVSGTLQAPDTNGHGTATITYDSTVYTYGYDIVSASRILLIQTDANATTVGEADLQTGTFATTSSLPAGSYAFSLNGIPYEFAAVGQIVTDGNGNIASSDVIENTEGTVTAATFPGTYLASDVIDGVHVNGRFQMSLTSEPSGLAESFILYMISPTQVLIMENDTNHLTFGQLLTQTGGPFPATSLNGNYGVNFSGIATMFESDVVGQFTAAGSTGTLPAGTVDINDEDLYPNTTTFPNSAISAGSFSMVTAATGHGTITFTAATATFAFNFYFVSPNQILLVETDDRVFLVTVGSALLQPTIP
jgi:hypothetical protein